jgi:hypothetical protein
MDWNKGYTAEYYITVVDPDSWKDREKIHITDGSISHESTELLESAEFTCSSDVTNKELLIRVWLDAYQGGEASHTPLFTGYATTPSRDINGNREKKKFQCYSILKPAQDVLLERGWYAPVDIDGAKLIKQLLKVTKANVIFSDKADKNRILKNAIIAESGETNLSMVWQILYAMNWRMKIDGYGTIYVEPYSSDEVAVFDITSNDIVEPSLTIDYDWYECPNVFRAILDDQVEIVRDEDDNSIMSIPSRGREVWAEEVGVMLNDRETLADYAKRRLKELQRVSTSISYDRRFDPNVYPTDVVYLNYPSHGIVGKYFVNSQNISLGYNCRTSEEVYKV